MFRVTSRSRVAVIGAGIAGAHCARVLSGSGCAVHVVDKSRGPGGRLATRRLEWLDARGQRRLAKVDHGAPAFCARGAGFQQFLGSASDAGTLVQWRPAVAAGSRPQAETGPLFLPQPDMPSWCRGLLGDIPGSWSFAVDRLVRDPKGWQIEAAGLALPGRFDAVILALPPAQAAPLLASHRSDWAQRASLALMQPCWTLMGVARRRIEGLAWAVARPDEGPLSWVMRNEARPGRDAVPDETHWVAHARAGWSRQHLEHPADWVQGQLQSALQDWLGEPVAWQHAVVHRWRYARPQVTGARPAGHCWWDSASGLGVCGDFLGGSGVEGAWQSAQALADTMLQGLPAASTGPGSSCIDGPAHPAAVRDSETRLSP